MIANLDAWLLSGEGLDFVLECTPVKISGGDVTFYASAYGKADPPSTTADSAALPVLRIPSVSFSVLASNFGTPDADGKTNLRQFQSSNLSTGTSHFEILNTSNLRDSWADGTYSWADAEALITVGVPGEDYATKYETLFSFKVHGQPTWTSALGGGVLRYAIKPALVNTSVPATTAVFDGTSGVTGGGPLFEGTRKPRLLGKVFNMRALMTDGANLRIAVDETSYDTLHKVYEGGFGLAGAGVDVTETAASGYYDLIAPPAHVMTHDATAGGITKCGDIWERLLSDESITAVNAASVTAYNSDFNFLGGAYLDPENGVSMGQALDDITLPYGFWFNSQDGTELHVQLPKSPAGESAAVDYVDADIVSVSVGHSAPPVWRVAMGYQRLSYVLDGVIGALEDADEIARLTQPQQFQTVSDSSVKDDYPNALDVEVASSLVDATEAATVAAAYLTLFKVKRYIYRVVLSTKAFQSWIGDYVSLTKTTCPTLQSTKNVLVTGVTLDIERRNFVLECWG